MFIKIAIFEKANVLCVMEVIGQTSNKERVTYKTRLLSNSGLNWDAALYEQNLQSEYLEHELRNPSEDELIKMLKYTSHNLVGFKSHLYTAKQKPIFLKDSSGRRIDSYDDGVQVNNENSKNSNINISRRNVGFIYIFSNPSFKDEMIKIGQTAEVYKRKSELNSTGVPTPFKTEYFAEINNYEVIEKKVHKILRQYRVNKDREFFNCYIPKAINVIRECSDIHDEKIYYKSPEEIEAERVMQEKLKKERDKKREEEKIKRDLKIKQDNIFREEQQKRDKQKINNILEPVMVLIGMAFILYIADVIIEVIR